MAEYDSFEAIRESQLAFDINKVEEKKEKTEDGFIADQRDLDDAVYGEQPGTVIYDTREEYADGVRDSERDRLFSQLQYTEEGRAVLLQFEDEARVAAAALLRDDGTDYGRHQRLVMTKNQTQYARDRYKEFMETTYQKPVLRSKK